MKTGRINGRGEWIRTTGLLVPNQALYQAEPRPDEGMSRLIFALRSLGSQRS